MLCWHSIPRRSENPQLLSQKKNCSKILAACSRKGNSTGLRQEWHQRPQQTVSHLKTQVLCRRYSHWVLFALFRKACYWVRKQREELVYSPEWRGAPDSRLKWFRHFGPHRWILNFIEIVYDTNKGDRFFHHTRTIDLGSIPDASEELFTCKKKKKAFEYWGRDNAMQCFHQKILLFGWVHCTYL